MVVEEKPKRVNKTLYKVELLLLKVLPYILALFYFANTILSVLGVDISFLSFLAGMSFLPLLFMYISSYVFKFCEYHRIPLHYILVNNIFSIIGYYCNIQVEVWNFIIWNIIVFFICLFVILYLYLKSRRDEKFNKQNP